uniref:Uncharacterized protein n=1 Tax=Romanomermis culicivorax TaxID=13658 RepID=A0A915K9D6_ROMCU
MVTEQNFHLFHSLIDECSVDLFYCTFFGQFAMHENQISFFLHTFDSTVAGQFTKVVVGIDNRKVENLSVSQDEAGV